MSMEKYKWPTYIKVNYPDWMKANCKLCAAGVPMRGGERIGHNTPDADECTAPTQEEYIKKLTDVLQEIANGRNWSTSNDQYSDPAWCGVGKTAQQMALEVLGK